MSYLLIKKYTLISEEKELISVSLFAIIITPTLKPIFLF